MISYSVPLQLLKNQERHDERFFNRIDMRRICELSLGTHHTLFLLGNMVESIGTGRGIPKEVQGAGEIAYLKVGNIARYQIDYTGAELISEETLVDQKMERLKSGDILISRVGTVGNVCMYQEDDPPATPSDNVLVVRLSEKSGIDSFYVCAFLNSSFGQAQLRRLTKQSLQEVVNQTGIKSLIVPVPVDEAQTRVMVGVNRHLDRIKELRKQVSETLATAAEVVAQELGYKNASETDMGLDELMSLIVKLTEQADEASKHLAVEGPKRGRPKKLILGNSELDTKNDLPGLFAEMRENPKIVNRKPGRPRKIPLQN